MENFFAEYGVFLLETITWVVAILVLFAGLIVIATKGKEKDKGKITIKKLNEKYRALEDKIKQEVLTKKDYKKFHKQTKQEQKQRAKADKQVTEPEQERKKVFVIQFHGDIKASQVNSLRREITAILTTATHKDEVVVVLESPGGMVSNYGLAASQLERIRQQKIPLTIAVDRVAASGGYMMACVGNKILAAPFAVIGSIGVIAQLPNFNRYLKKRHIDFEQITAGEYKRTLTMFGENTRQGREKMQQDLEEIHHYFKEFIKQNRSQTDVDKVATGEYWLASRALELNLVDELMTSDDYLLKASRDADIFLVKYKHKKSLPERLSKGMQVIIDQVKESMATNMEIV